MFVFVLCVPACGIILPCPMGEAFLCGLGRAPGLSGDVCRNAREYLADVEARVSEARELRNECG